MNLRFDLPDAAQIKVFRAMGPADRVQAGLAATETVRLRLRAHFSDLHPDWSAERVEAAVAQRMLRDRD